MNLENVLGFITQHLPGALFAFTVIALIYMYAHDKLQSKHAIRRNYPIIGRFRYLFEYLSTFFRQYFADDQSEEPFNRSQRAWVYRAAKGVSTYGSFGSTNHRDRGSIVFLNRHFAMVNGGKDGVDIGATNPYVEKPYKANSCINISGMSFGALSENAVKALSHGARLSGSYINTGEGGPSKYHKESGADLFIQLGTAKYGFRDENGKLDIEKLKREFESENFKALEIKLSQSAKPGQGGILPANKVTEEIAEERGIIAWEASISPSRHEEINNFKDLFEFIAMLRANTKKPVGIKMCIGDPSEIRHMFSALARETERVGDLRYVMDFFTLDAEGGTGSAPMGLLESAGLPMKDGLPFLRGVIDNYPTLSPHIKIIASGKLINPKEVAWALASGADLVATARGAMLSLGCIQSLHCHTDKCPTGIATQNKELQKGLDPKLKMVRVKQYIEQLNKEVNQIANSCGAEHWTDLNQYHISHIGSEDLAVQMRTK